MYSKKKNGLKIFFISIFHYSIIYFVLQVVVINKDFRDYSSTNCFNLMDFLKQNGF